MHVTNLQKKNIENVWLANLALCVYVSTDLKCTLKQLNIFTSIDRVETIKTAVQEVPSSIPGSIKDFNEFTFLSKNIIYMKFCNFFCYVNSIRIHIILLYW